MNDVARLQRRWARRMAADGALQKRAAELAAEGAGPLPAIHAEPVALKPFPWSKPSVTRPAPASRPAVDGDPGGLPLDRDAAITAELAEPCADRVRVLGRHGVTTAAFDALDALWKQRIAGDLSLDRDHRRLVEHQRARLRSAAAAPAWAAPALPPLPESPPAAFPRLAGTALAWDVPRGPALPFAEGAPLADIGSPTAGERAALRPHEGLGRTSLALDLPHKRVLPFLDETDPERGPPAPRAPAELADTSLLLDIPRGLVLPFSPSARAGGPEPKPAPKGLAGGTSRAVDVPRGPAVPFLAPVKSKSSSPGAASAAPRLTLEQHASLSVEVAAAPERFVATLARYRLTPVQKRETDIYYGERFAADPSLREAWDLACRTYREWFLEQSGRRR